MGYLNKKFHAKLASESYFELPRGIYSKIEDKSCLTLF